MALEVDRLGGDPVVDRRAGLLGPLGNVLGGARHLEQRAVLQHRQVELAEVDPILARHQQLAVRAARLGRLVAAEPRREVLDPVAALGELALVDEVDARRALHRAHIGNRFAEAFVGDVGVGPDVERRRQRADVGGENPVRATSHEAPRARRLRGLMPSRSERYCTHNGDTSVCRARSSTATTKRGDDAQDRDRTTTPPHGLRHQGSGGDPRVLRGHARVPAAGHVVGGRRAVRRRARLLPHVLRPRRRQRAGVLPVRRRGRIRRSSTPTWRRRRSATSR